MNIILFIMAFANFVFYPLVIGFIIALIIEQVLRRTQSENTGNIFIAMTVRKFLWRNAWIANIIWFVGYAILLFMLKPGTQQMPDMIWEGGL
jgi:TctA family transporter